MNLYLFPESASLDNGYGIAVKEAFDKLCPQKGDYIVWYSNSYCLDQSYEHSYNLARKPLFSVYRILNVLTLKISTEVKFKDLLFLKDLDFEYIHCDEVLFYRALRKIFPNKTFTVRFHNCYSRILDRKRLLKMNLDWKFEVLLRTAKLLEREIMNDEKVHKVFLSNEDFDYYKLMYKRNDAEVWLLKPNEKEVIQSRKNLISIKRDKIVWFGGADTHKKKSIDWFIKEVLTEIRKKYPTIEFHLWGRNTEIYNDSSSKIYAHGYYKEAGFPFSTEAIYVNPDIIGCGVKLKVLTYLEAGIPFVSTFFGFEGYDNAWIDNKFCFVTEPSKFAAAIISCLEG